MQDFLQSLLLLSAIGQHIDGVALLAVVFQCVYQEVEVLVEKGLYAGVEPYAFTFCPWLLAAQLYPLERFAISGKLCSGDERCIVLPNAFDGFMYVHIVFRYQHGVFGKKFQQ